ncbi:aminotransferase class I/II-fold pyridoxal phosphate-dependent enzyme [Candidatus Protochlamydia naegleriophila]|nr:aminotransferase class I/II-fold pyridoxal phosphate-dependent enzyme [Candidatus Protochlamydia naegleriophila]
MQAIYSQRFIKKLGTLNFMWIPKNRNPFFYTASGSKQLIVALVYAIVTSSAHKKFVFVEQAPFYSGHLSAVSGIFHYPNARFLAFHEPSEIVLEPGEELVEFVTSPNNPDGKFRKPLTEAEILIADFVFASTAFGSDEAGYLDGNLEWIRQARADGKHVFSFNSASKQFGKTGSRCGYIWYPLYDAYAESIFKQFFGFISSSTVAAGTVGLAHFLDLIKAFLDMPDTGKALRQDAKQSLTQRHILMEKEFLRNYPGSTILSIVGSPTFFARIQDKRIPNKRASDILLEDLNVSVNSGDSMGETSEFIRLNLCGNSEQLVQLLNRLARERKYTRSDVFFSSAAPKLTDKSPLSQSILPDFQ